MHQLRQKKIVAFSPIARHHSPMVASSIIHAPFGLKADGTPRRRREGAGRKPLKHDDGSLMSSAERQERWRAAKAQWWRDNRDKAAQYRAARREKKVQERELLEKNREKSFRLHRIDVKIDGAFPIRWFFPNSSWESHDVVGPLMLPQDAPEALELLSIRIKPISNENIETLINVTRSFRNYVRKIVELRVKKGIARKVCISDSYNRRRDMAGSWHPNKPSIYRPAEEVLAEVESGLIFLRRECRRRKLPARFLMGRRALQFRCTEDAKPCNTGQADAAQSVEIPK